MIYNFLIPKPKKIIRRQGEYKCRSNHVIYYSGGLKYLAERLCDEFYKRTGISLKTEKMNDDGKNILISSPGYSGSLSGNSFENKEGYFLRMEEECILLQAETYRGMVNAWGTMVQIIRSGEGLAAADIKDYPDLDMRGIHFDLKGCMPTADYLCKLIERLALIKINSVLIEYEDKFPFEKHSVICAESCLTPEEVKRINETADKYAIELIPLVQCFGHVEYILKHDEYKHLGEGEMMFSLCPSKSESFDVVKDMIGEMIESHQSRYFHIGADETRGMGSCPECRKYIDKYGRGRQFIEYVKNVTEFVINIGKIPIMWGDMFCDAGTMDLIDELPQETVIHFWEYHIFGEKTPWLKWNDRVTATKYWMDKDPQKYSKDTWFDSEPVWIEDMPEKDRNYIRDNMFGDSQSKEGDPLFWIDLIKDKGYLCIGGPAIKNVASRNAFFADFDLRFENTQAWVKKAVQKNLGGIINTSWSRVSSSTPPAIPIEILWYNTAASAELCWDTGMSREKFNNKFNNVYANGQLLTNVLDYLSRARRSKQPVFIMAASVTMKKILSKIQNSLFTDIVELAVRYQQMITDLDTILEHGEWLVYYTKQSDIMPQRVNHKLKYVNNLRQLKKKWLKWESDAVSILSEFMPEQEVTETVLTKSKPCIMRIEFFIRSVSDITADNM